MGGHCHEELTIIQIMNDVHAMRKVTREVQTIGTSGVSLLSVELTRASCELDHD